MSECRFKLEAEGKPYPKSGCTKCNINLVTKEQCPYSENLLNLSKAGDIGTWYEVKFKLYTPFKPQYAWDMLVESLNDKLPSSHIRDPFIGYAK